MVRQRQRRERNTDMGYRKNRLKQRRERQRRRRALQKIAGSAAAFVGMLLVIVCLQYGNVFENIRYETCFSLFQSISPVLAKENMLYVNAEDEASGTAYGTSTESSISYEAILAQEAADENQSALDQESAEEAQTANQGTVDLSLDKLKDFDYLLQKCYTVDKTTTITASQLNAETLLTKDCTIKRDATGPQILIYHTHSQEGYADSVEGDAGTTVVGVGDELTRLLTEEYGYQVLHDTGQYDVNNRDHAYSNAAPELEKILAEHPSIEVVIDLHRDGVGEGTRLVTQVNGVQMAQIMFFNGLSRTTAVGDIDYLYNPYIEDNLAFSLQLQVASMEEYPGFSRKIYLKGYRYNMHYCPKSLLVEVGAQTNTVQEAKNAMGPLAAVLDKVLSGK